MAKTATKKAAKPKTARKTTKKREKPLGMLGRFAFVFMAIIGLGVMWYLTGLHYGDGSSGACDLSEKLSCSSVNVSEYSEVLGIPVSIMGLAYFAVILLVGLFFYNRENVKRIGYVSILFLGPSLYLSFLEATVIGSWCLFCEYSKVIMLGMVLVSFDQLGGLKNFGKDVLQSGIVLAIIFAGGTWFAQTVFTGDSVPEGKYSEFAQCLSDKGCVMYGSARCQYCGKQRKSFGDAFDKYITEIECDAREEDNDAERCIELEIEKTPTWMIEDGSGNVIDRLESGYKTLEELSEWSGCPLPVEE